MQAELQQQPGGTAFGSLAELRSEHSILMREARKEGREASASRVAGFIARAEATGALIESQNDRDSAQGVIDYWAAWQFSSNSLESLSATPPTLVEFVPSAAERMKPAENPYVGLRAFEERDAGLFIGREEATRKLLDKLRTHPVVFVTGPLGSGKSSLVFAGVVPRLRSRAVLESETRKEPVFLTVIPGRDPITALLRSVLLVAAAKPPNSEDWITDQRKAIVRKPDSLGAIVNSVAPGSDIVLIVDQFEEIFTLCSDLAAREQFTQAIAGLVKDASGLNRVILIIREDYAEQSFAIAAFKPFADDTDAHFTPPLLTRAELVRVITSSAEAVGLKFDDGIVEDLAQDVAGDPASLPTLQFTLSRLWASLPPDGNRITREIYQKVGKPRDALAQAAEAVFNSFTPSEQAVVQHVFLELVQPVIGNDLRRRRVPLDNLVQVTGDDADVIATVLKRFEDAELIRRTKGFEADDDRFEVAHEALATNWKRLSDWLIEKRQDSTKKLQLITTARLWQESGQSAGYLLTGDAIRDAMPYRDQAPEVRDLIAASEASAKRYAWMQRLAGTVLTLVIGAITTLYVVTVSNRTVLRKDFDERDAKIQQLEYQAATVDAITSRLRDAERTIVQQQDLIGQLQRLRPGPLPQPLPAPPLPPKPNPAAGDISAVGQKGWIWIGSDPSTNLKDPKDSTAAIPTAISQNGRYIVSRNVVLRSEKPTDAYVQSDSLGLVPSGTPVTALGTAIPYDRPSGTKQYWLPVNVDPSDKPIVYYQFANTSRPDAQQLADSIQAAGYRIPEVQGFDIAKGTNEVRYFFSRDKPAAAKLAADVTKILRDRRLVLSPTKVVDLTGSTLDKNFPGVLELWLDTTAR